MHQPSYVDPVTGDVTMPWVRLHGVKDYTDMGALLEGVEDTRVTFNFVPGLIDQLERAAHADPASDRFLRLTLTPPEALDAHDRAFVTRWFFSLHHPTLLEPHPRYRELRELAQSGEPLDDDALRDLQLLFNLAWCGAVVRSRPEIASLIERERGFTEADKATLIASQQAAIGAIVPRYAALAAAGRIELTCTPHEHPILPLLIDSDLARAARPSTLLPTARYRWPGDARAHVARALASHARRFGAPPRGMWPAEGAVAAEVLPLMRDAGVRWIASDETVLRKSLGLAALAPSELYSPWDSEGVTLFFRHHGLSDLIGFDYARWVPEDAWRDFANHLAAAHAALDGADGVVTVALDGENCWEHYPGGSTGFLPGLYRAIAATPGLRLSTFSEALAAVPPRPLPRLAPGSWIDGTFATWLGDPVKNRAWELLSAARDAVGEPFAEVEARDPELADLILKAEASDWWWWFGEGHSTSFDADFDALFRAHLVAIHHRVGVAAPAALAQPVASAAHPAAGAAPPTSRRPLRQLRPRVDGRRDWFFKWRSAGVVAPTFGAIHRGAGLVHRLVYANDDGALSLRLDLGPSAAAVLERRRVALQGDGASPRPPVALWPPDAAAPGVEAAAGDVFEAQVPLATMGVTSTSGLLRCRIELRDDAGELLECFPPTGWCELTLLDRRASGANHWA
jgi:alpha-amylase/alpha-mannosidase (GH57 family)